jgi:hypothetical protein
MTVTTVLGMGSSTGCAKREGESVVSSGSRLVDREAISRRTLACARDEMKANARVCGQHSPFRGKAVVAWLLKIPTESRVTG